jgi:hypothetical protein
VDAWTVYRAVELDPGLKATAKSGETEIKELYG